MSKTSSQAMPATTAGMTRSSASLLARQNTLGPHVSIQRDGAGAINSPAASSLVRDVIGKPGSPLDASTRSEMEPRFGVDFSNVRVHSDDQAAESSRAMNANAYTTGEHVVFNSGKYSPGTPSGQQLMAHELTHVVQQASGPVEGKPVGDGLSVSDPSDRFEQAASHLGTEFGPVQKTSDLISLPSAAQGGSRVIQRDNTLNDQSGTGAFAARQTNAAEASATAGQISAAAGGVSAASSVVFGILGAVYAAEAAHAGRRQADAAEDPPVGEPVEGGAKSNNPVDIPEIKAPARGSGSKETLDVKDTTKQARKDNKIGKDETQTVSTTVAADGKTTVETTTKRKGEIVSKETAVTSPAASSEGSTPQKSLDLLRVQEGSKNVANYKLILESNGTDISGGNTEDGDISGYTGGSVASNINVNFKTKPGSPVTPATPETPKGAASPPPIAAVQIQFGGFNTPPRMTLQQDSDDKPIKTANNPQRFSGTVKVDASGKVVDKPRVSVNPSGGGPTFGDGIKGPIVGISLNAADPTAKKKEDEKKGGK